jgi:hypothetical protein
MSKRSRKKKKYIPKRADGSLSYSPVRTEVIKLKNVFVDGFAAGNALPGEQVSILVRTSITSDEREFHVYMEGISNLLTDRAKEMGIIFSLDALTGFVLIVHSDGTADLHIGNKRMSIEMLTKRDLKAGEVVYGSDIGDIRRVKYGGLTFLPSDKVYICFKVKWKFGLFFDLAADRQLDVDKMERELGSLYRHLQYQGLYEALSDQVIVDRMKKEGWFPFIEIIGGDFEPLLKAYATNFDIENKEQGLIVSFTPERIERLAQRWWKNQILSNHKEVLVAGLEAFKRGDFVSCIKNIMTEIEGVLAHVHLAEKGSIPKTKELLAYAVEHGVNKTGDESSLFFPSEFLKYLNEVAYADFDPRSPAEAGASRHTVGHGFAGGGAYTPARALQVILTLDQIAFYL